MFNGSNCDRKSQLSGILTEQLNPRVQYRANLRVERLQNRANLRVERKKDEREEKTEKKEMMINSFLQRKGGKSWAQEKKERKTGAPNGTLIKNRGVDR